MQDIIILFDKKNLTFCNNNLIGQEKKMSINEECLLQYLTNSGISQSFVMECLKNGEIFDCPEYNEVAWLFT